jgi:pimeloyl-ACP methyl ester carboxylesterase
MPGLGVILPDPYPLIYLHGLFADSRGVKASLLRKHFPQVLTPDFSGSLEERMDLLGRILGDTSGWRIVGSSFGGLMGALFALQHPEQVKKLILFSPALIWPDFAGNRFEPVSVPVVIYHGTRDELVPIEAVRPLAEQAFQNLVFHSVDDDHGMYQTVHKLDWLSLLVP